MEIAEILKEKVFRPEGVDWRLVSLNGKSYEKLKEAIRREQKISNEYNIIEYGRLNGRIFGMKFY